MSLAALLQQVVGVLEAARVPYMLTGSLAAAYYATPRATQDIDIVVAPEEAGLRRAVEGLSAAGYYVDLGAPLEALRSNGQFNAVDPDTGWKVDLIIRRERDFSRAEFDRRQPASLLGVEVSLASLEDLLLAKMEWAKLGDSQLQRSDIVQILERAGDRLDRAYVERRVGELGLADEWARGRSSLDVRSD